MEPAGRHDRVHVSATQKRLRRAAWYARFRPALKRAMPILIVGVAAAGCSTGPEVKTVVQETFSIEAIEGTSRQTIRNVTVEDLGEAQKVFTPVTVQACDGPLLLYRQVERTTEEGETYVEQYPAFETVDPFEGNRLCTWLRLAQHFVGEGIGVEGETEERAESGVASFASVEAKDELVEVGLQVLAAQPVVDASCPSLEV